MARSTAATLAALLIATVSCSDPGSKISHADPTNSDTKDHAPTAKRAQGDRPPKLPAIAKQNSLAGAENFVLHYIDLLNYASDTGNTRPLRLISDENCGGCFDYIALYDKIYGRGGYFRRGDWIAQERLFKQRYKQSVRVVVTVDAEPGEYRTHRSATVKSHGRAQYSLTVIVAHGGDGWKVVEFDGSKT